MVSGANDATLFLTKTGEVFCTRRLSALVRDYIAKAKINKSGSCHLFRHSMATLMLENGADIRFIQAMLGHASLTSTQLYTHVSIRKLKDIHNATHPGRVIVAGQGGGHDGSASSDIQDALLAILDAEAQEES
jgi:integrase/recombinase XerD